MHTCTHAHTHMNINLLPLILMPHPPEIEYTNTHEQPQCRICFDGPDPTLGRLIRPCLCSGTVSVGLVFYLGVLHRADRDRNFFFYKQHVHLACLQRWRNSSVNASAFFVCPQCHYRYRFARTRVVGLATNPGSPRPNPTLPLRNSSNSSFLLQLQLRPCLQSCSQA